MDTKDWLLVTGPIVGIVLGGTITTIGKFLELRHLRKAELQNLRLARLERLHELASEMITLSTTFSIKIGAAGLKNLGATQLEELLAAESRILGEQFAKINSLQRIYAPSLKLHQGGLIVVMEDLNRVLHSGPITDVDSRLAEVHKRCRDFTEGIEAQINDLIG
ncbi:MAG: hypothetical protein ABI878_07795 [Acidobacteriota bacterium]